MFGLCNFVLKFIHWTVSTIYFIDCNRLNLTFFLFFKSFFSLVYSGGNTMWSLPVTRKPTVEQILICINLQTNFHWQINDKNILKPWNCDDNLLNPNFFFLLYYFLANFVRPFTLISSDQSSVWQLDYTRRVCAAFWLCRKQVSSCCGWSSHSMHEHGPQYSNINPNKPIFWIRYCHVNGFSDYFNQNKVIFLMSNIPVNICGVCQYHLGYCIY